MKQLSIASLVLVILTVGQASANSFDKSYSRDALYNNNTWKCFPIDGGAVCCREDTGYCKVYK